MGVIIGPALPSGTVKIALLQFATTAADKATNLATMRRLLHAAGDAGARLAVLPELCLSGYRIGERVRELAESIPGPATEEIGALAQRHSMHVVFGMPEASRILGTYHNAAAFIGPDGALIGVYRKTHLPVYLHSAAHTRPIEERELFTPGDRLPVFDTAIGRIGILICHDGNYPEAYRVLALRGAQLIVMIYNTAVGEMLTIRTRAAAFANSCYVALANWIYTEADPSIEAERRLEATGQPGATNGTVPRPSGRSHVVDPRGRIVAEASPTNEEILLADIDLGEVERARWDVKFMRDRRQELYGPIVEAR